MLKISQIKCPVNREFSREEIASKLHCRPEDILSYTIDRCSLDARHDELVQRRGGGNDDKLDEAQKLILENVDEHGKIEAAAAYQLGEDAGISNSTMKSARSKLGMYTKKEGFKGKTIWSMPETMTGDDLKDLVSD